MRLFWTSEALQDRRATREYIARDNPAAAILLDELFSQKARRLTGHPEIGRVGRVPGTRELIVHRNYIIIYDVTEDAVRILRVLHARRNWPPQK